MYNTLLNMYKTGRLTDVQLDKAVSLGWITQSQESEIKSAKSPAVSG